MMPAQNVEEHILAGRRVAVILEKDPFFRDFQSFVLGKQGYAVRHPQDPAEYTADWVRAQQPSLIITEIMLPGKNGLDLTRELKTPPPVGCPVIVYSVLQAKERALAAGADKFLQKPVLREGYLSAVTSLVKQSG